MTDLMSVREAARRLGVHPKKLHRMCANKEITYYMVGSRRKLSEADIAAYLADWRTFPAEKHSDNSHATAPSMEAL
jgi:excisionase family DNA binding protein